MPVIGEEEVRRIKAANDLVDVMGGYTTLRRAGHDFKACCPFHQERTPSMHLYTDQQTYHCFGCGAHGDVVSLVRDQENLDFVETMEFLARRAGIQIQYQQGKAQDAQKRGERQRLTDVMEMACAFYEQSLWNDPAAQPAREYLQGRRLPEDLCREFRLGWAAGRGQLLSYLKQQGVSEEDAIRLDLAVRRDDGRVTDRFWERITFPICDRFAHPLAFSARLLPEAERRAKEEGTGVGKYINSRDTPLYHKGDVVFNLHRARRGVREAGRLVVMEGPTDVMAAYQAGLSACVAVLGTALTQTHARLLGQAVGDVAQLTLLFDGDAAGQAAAVKNARTLLASGVPCRVCFVPDGNDPDELLHEGGPEALLRILERGETEIDHLLHSLAPRPYALPPQELLAAVDDILAAVRPLADQELRQLHVQRIAEWTGLDSDRLRRRLAQAGQPAIGATVQEPAQATLPALDAAQERALHILVRYPDLRALGLDQLGMEPCQFPAGWQDLVTVLVERPDIDHDGLILRPEIQAQPALCEAVYRWRREPLPAGVSSEDALQDQMAQAARTLRRRVCEERIGRLQHELRTVDRGDAARVRHLFAELAAQQRLRQDLLGAG